MAHKPAPIRTPVETSPVPSRPGKGKVKSHILIKRNK